MRITFLTREYLPDTAWGGQAVMYHTLARALAGQGHEVHVICQAVSKPEDNVEAGVFVHQVGTNPKRYSAIARINYSFHAWQKLSEIIKTHNIEVVDAACWGAEGFLYSLFKSVPLIVGVATSSLDILETKTYSGKKEFFIFKVLSLIEDFTVKRADRVVAYSRAVYTHLTCKLGIAPDKVDIVHHAIDIDKFKFVESDIRQKLGVSNDAYLVLFAGRLESRKGAHILCQAIPHILEQKPDVRFVLLGHDTNTAPGGGSFKHHIVSQAQSGGFNDNLVFIDFLPDNELVQLYSACDILISASLKESFGLTVIEAMSCGKPVVATSVGIVPELQHYGSKGVSVIPAGEAQILAEASIKFLSLDDKHRKELGIRNRHLIEKDFSITMWVAKMIEVYRQTHGEIGNSSE